MSDYTAEEVKAFVRAAVQRMRYACEEGSTDLRGAASRIIGCVDTLGTPEDHTAFSEFSVARSEREWKSLDDVPKNGTPFVVRTTHSFRWAPYVRVPDSKHPGMEKIGDVIGRWQAFDRMNWVNSPRPVGEWKP